MAGEAIRFNASLNTAGFDSGAARLQQVAAQASGKVSASFGAMGGRIAAVIAPFVGLYAAINSVKGALDLGGRMNDLSKTTGETAGNLAILERAFQNAGVGGEKMSMAIASMSNFMTDFQAGSTTASETMGRLGLSMADLAGKSPIKQMRVFMAAIAGIQDPALRTAMAMDVFKKAGKEIVPLASDFSGELANAQAELGSLPRILNENAPSLDVFGDKLTNSVGSKLTELAVGLAAGATGANGFVDALSKIDAAGLGERIGDSLRAAFGAPLETVQALGDFLISGILKAGNALAASFKYAIEVFYNLFTDSGFWSGIGDRIMGSLAKLGEGFALVVVNGLQAALGALKNVPFLGEFAERASASLEGVKASIIEAGQNASMALDEGGEKIAEAWQRATASSGYVYEDMLGADEYAQSASDHWQNAKDAASAIKNDSAKTAENFGTGSATITNALNAMRGFSLNPDKDKVAPIDPTKSEAPVPQDPIDPTKSEAPVPQDSAPTAPASGSSEAGSGVSSTPTQTINERIGEMRGNANARAADAAAKRFEEGGFFRSAVNAQDRAQRAKDRAMQGARIKDILGGKNMGEAYRDYEKTTGMDRMSQKEFEKSIRDQAATPEERTRAENRANKSGKDSKEGGSTNDPMKAVVDIYKLLTERLPIHVLAA
jgi:hypothetical protein